MKKILDLKSLAVFILTILFLFQTSSAKTSSENLYWMKVSARDKFERSVIADTGVSIEAIKEDFVAVIATESEKSALEKFARIEVSFPLTAEHDFPAEDSKYHNYSELSSTLLQITNNNPDVTELISLGKSVEQRDIWAVRISGQLERHDLPAVIFMGGHHAREHLSVELPLAYIKYLVEQYHNGNERIISLIRNRDIYFIPAVNPDGLEYDVSGTRYKTWRKSRARNSDGTFGVDLNRNYGYQWGTGGSSNSPNSDTYMGPAPFSEPETKAIRDFVNSKRNTTILLSFHTFSELILYPWGHSYEGISNGQDKLVHETMARKMSEWNHYQPQQASDLYIASGDTTDWAYGTHRIISFTFELDPANQWGGSGGFYPGDEIIPQVVEKNLEPVLYLIANANNPYQVLQ